MKKYICGLLALSLLMLGGCGGKSEKIKVTDVICPYTIQTQRDGSLQVEVETDKLPGYDWQCDMYWKDVCQVEIDQQEERAVFTLTGLKEGLEEIDFLYMKGGETPDYRFQMTAQVNVDGENTVLLQQHSCQSLSGNGSGGEGTEFPYRWSTNESGVVTLSLDCEDSISWSLVGEECEAYALGDLLYGQGGCAFAIHPRAEGEGVAVLEHDTTGRQLPIGIGVDRDLCVTVRMEGAPGAEAADNG